MTSGGRTVARLLVFAAPIGVAVQVSINAMSRISDTADLGRSVSPRVAWSMEVSSGIAIILLLPAIWWVAGRLWPAVIGWTRSIAGHAAASVIFSLFHVVLMTLLRLVLLGQSFASTPTIEVLLYEYRKDAWSYALLACILASARWIGGLSEQSTAALDTSSNQARVLIIQDGKRRHLLPREQIDFIEAAGNYVEVVAGASRLLHRSTLAAVADELGGGFVKIHRSRLVNAARVRLIETNASGDFEVETVSGDRLKGSRRFKTALEACA